MQITKDYRPLPPQENFHRSLARIRGYGGAMGGGKSRALCEEAFKLGMQYPGLPTVICRQRHTAIIETTRRTFFDQVLPPELHQFCKIKQSGGEDYCQLPNGSTFHFIGLEDPVKWFSSELGLLVFDEAHEIAEHDVVQLITRLRWAGAPTSSFITEDAPGGLAGLALLGFNPENPGHWLQRWMILNSSPTDFGFRKPELWVEDANKPIGDCEFTFARAADNPHLPPGYVENTLGGLPERMRKRFLDGEWLFTSGRGFFDQDALTWYAQQARDPRWTGRTVGVDDRLVERFRREKKTVDKTTEGKIRLKPGEGGWQVWELPVRERWEDGVLLPEHRYIAAVDVSSGGSTDYSAIQVIDIDDFAQVAEFQGKLDPDEVALEAYRIGMIYNTAIVAPEITGGWGMTIATELKRLAYPKPYLRRVRDRLTDQWTDKLGWDTNTRTRMMMLDTLERVLRERDLVLHSARALAELGWFVRPEKQTTTGVKTDGKPEAQGGHNDDLVVALAIGVTIATQLPRQLRQRREQEPQQQFAATGW